VARCGVNSEQMEWLLDLQNNGALDIWSITADYVEVHLVPNDANSKRIQSSLNCAIVIEDLETHFQQSLLPAPNLLDDFYDQYPTYEQIVQQLSNLAKQYPTLAKYEPSMGKSIENRDLPYIIITGNKSATKWNVYIEGGLHAREWIAPVTTVYLAEALLANYTTNSAVAYLMDRIIFHIAPECNPDGYIYSWSTDRNWRKNRRNNGNSYGVDLNRNFDDHWGGQGSSGVPTSDTYRGTAPTSEPETKAINAYVLSLPKRLGGIDYHSYGPDVLRNWGWTATASADESWLKPLGDGWRDTIRAVYNVSYTSQRAGEMYVACGGCDDWMTSGGGMLGKGWTIELRGNSFVLPAAQIRPTGVENFAGLLYWARQLTDRFGNA